MPLIRVVVISALMLAGSACALAGTKSPTDRPLPMPSAWLSTSGNRIVDASGQTWMGRGVNLHDTRSCKACAFERPGPQLVQEVKRRIDFLVNDWGINLIRLNLESYPPDDAEVGELAHYGGVLDDPGYFAEVVDLVRHIGTKPGVYVLLSLWHEPSFDQRLAIPSARTRMAWEKLAGALVRDPHVIFGVANEPQGNNEADDAEVWQSMNQAVAAIRAVEERVGATHHLIAVQGTRDYARDVRYYLDHPITAGGGVNIVYEAHIYNPAADFNDLIAVPYARLPMLIGEFGPVQRPDDLTMTLEDSERLMELAETLRIPYAAWTFHMRCPPNLLEDTAPGHCGTGMELRPTPWGEQVRRRLLDGRRNR